MLKATVTEVLSKLSTIQECCATVPDLSRQRFGIFLTHTRHRWFPWRSFWRSVFTYAMVSLEMLQSHIYVPVGANLPIKARTVHHVIT